MKKGFFTDRTGRKSLTRLLLFVTTIFGYLLGITGVILLIIGHNEGLTVLSIGTNLLFASNYGKLAQNNNYLNGGYNDQTNQL